MTCSEFLDGYSDYLDGAYAPARAERFGAHLAECASCAGYDRALQNGLDILSGLDLDVPEDFQARLERRLALDAEDARSGFGPLGSAATNRLVAAVTVLIALVAWSPTLRSPESEAAQVAPAAALDPGLGMDPMAAGELTSTSPAATELWSYPNALMYEYSTLGSRNRTHTPNDRVVRAVGLE